MTRETWNSQCRLILNVNCKIFLKLRCHLDRHFKNVYLPARQKDYPEDTIVASLKELYLLKEVEENIESTDLPTELGTGLEGEERANENESRVSSIPFRNPLCTLLTRPSKATHLSLLVSDLPAQQNVPPPHTSQPPRTLASTQIIPSRATKEKRKRHCFICHLPNCPGTNNRKNCKILH